MTAPFAKLSGITPARLDTVIDAFSDDDWNHIEDGYLQVAAHEIGDWWKPALGLREDVDVLLLLCNLYQRSLTRKTTGV